MQQFLQPRRLVVLFLGLERLEQHVVHFLILQIDLQRGPDPQAAVGAPGPGVDVGDGVGEQQPADLQVAGLAELDGVVGRAVQAGYLAGEPLGVAQVVQSSDNLELSFGLAPPSSNRALAAFTAFSSASSSLIRRRACSSGSAW